MLEFSASEKRVLKLFQSKPNKKLDVPEIARAFYEGRRRPANWHNSITAFMRTFRLHCALNDLDIQRVTAIGAGNQAQYSYFPAPAKKPATTAGAARRPLNRQPGAVAQRGKGSSKASAAA